MMDQPKKSLKGILKRNSISETSRESAQDSSSSSNYDSPVSSPTDEDKHVRKCQHSCGSLFGKCSNHQVRPLVQTFTDTTSELSRETFPSATKRSHSFHGNQIIKCPLRPKNLSEEVLCYRNLIRSQPEAFLFDAESIARIQSQAQHNKNQTVIICRHISLTKTTHLSDSENETNRLGSSSSLPVKNSPEHFSDDDEENYPPTWKMGNGVAGCNGLSDQKFDKFDDSVSQKLQKQIKDWEIRADGKEKEVLALKKEIKKRDQENMQLQREIDKLKSVLQQSIIADGDLLTRVQDSHEMPGQTVPVVSPATTVKKQGVSAESSDFDNIEIQRFEKDFRAKQLIKYAILENDFLKNLDTSQVREIVECMVPREYQKNSYVIKEGHSGANLYVSAEGEFEVVKKDKPLGRMGPGKAFGELAILYNCRRTASVKVLSQDAKVWVLDRRVFQKIMMRTGMQRLQDNINFLKSVPLLHKLSYDVLSKIADVLEVEFYPVGAHIIRQGAAGDTFFIISSGIVKVTQKIQGRREEEEIRTLTKGDYFGEQALLKEDCRTANIIALPPGVECLTLDRNSFIQLIGDLSELHEKDYGDETRALSRPSSLASIRDEEEFDYVHLDDLDVITTLGVGGFGRVELVQYIYDRSLTFALKCLKKKHIVDTQQQEHVYSEKNIMKACSSVFICRLYKTYRDSKYVYMLLESCLGGEVWTLLRDRGSFDESTAKFITGCVLEAFDYLHARGIVYRDLKPENLLLDHHGYAKLVDFGFSKRLGFCTKTWTFCGTPEYVAPEIILNKGHDRAVDYWSLGVLMHELLTGTPPFAASDPMKTYNLILKGIDMVNFPSHFTRSARSLIKRLCRDSPSERLGYQRGGVQDIKKHKWYQGFHWDGLKAQSLKSPFTPNLRGPIDTSHFDNYPKDLEEPPDEFSNWDAEF